MTATHNGGVKAAKTNKERYGEDFYRKIGAMGGKVSRGGGFAIDRELAREAGRKGGLSSRRGKVKTVFEEAKNQEKVLEKEQTAWREKVGLDENSLQ